MKKVAWIPVCFREYKQWASACIALYVTIFMLVASACSPSITLPFRFSPFEEVQTVLCKGVVEDEPDFPTDVFTTHDQQICVLVKAKFEDSATELLTSGEQIAFTFTWYYEGQTIASDLIMSPVSSDMWVTVSDCLAAKEDSFLEGQYQVRVEHSDIEIGKVNFRVE